MSFYVSVKENAKGFPFQNSGSSTFIVKAAPTLFVSLSSIEISCFLIDSFLPVLCYFCLRNLHFIIGNFKPGLTPRCVEQLFAFMTDRKQNSNKTNWFMCSFFCFYVIFRSFLNVRWFHCGKKQCDDKGDMGTWLRRMFMKLCSVCIICFVTEKWYNCIKLWSSLCLI